MFERLAGLEDEFADVEARLSDPSVHSDRHRYAELARRHKELDALVSRSRQLRGRKDDLDAAKQMLTESAGDDREFARSEVESAEHDIERLEQELRLLLLPKDPNDDKNVIVEIRGAEGGEEANLFARDLFNMYAGFAERSGWKLEVLSSSPSDMGGFNEVIFRLEGDGVWSRMKYEAGPHRVQRVPVTESQGRVHTSSATVTVLPEAEEIDLHIDPNDLETDVFRSSGPGGQSVNTTDSAVRITHRPTGIVVSMQDEKSQIQNRARAMQVLRARLLKLEQDRQAAELSEQRRGQIGGGGRSEKIRTYNFKENRVSDHRIGLTVYRLDRVLQGELDEFADALVADDQAAPAGCGGWLTGAPGPPQPGAPCSEWRPPGCREPVWRRPTRGPAHRRGGLGLGGRRARPAPRRPVDRAHGPHVLAHARPEDRRRAAAVRAGTVGLPHARPLRRPPGADPPARDRTGGRGGDG